MAELTTEQRVIRTVAKALKRDPSEVTPATHLLDDLGADSGEMLVVTVALEEEFPGMSISDSEPHMHVVQQLIERCARG